MFKKFHFFSAAWASRLVSNNWLNMKFYWVSFEISSYVYFYTEKYLDANLFALGATYICHRFAQFLTINICQICLCFIPSVSDNRLKTNNNIKEGEMRGHINCKCYHVTHCRQETRKTWRNTKISILTNNNSLIYQRRIYGHMLYFCLLCKMHGLCRWEMKWGTGWTLKRFRVYDLSHWSSLLNKGIAKHRFPPSSTFLNLPETYI